MAFTRYQILLSVMMVVTGTINSLSVKWVDLQWAVGRDGVSRQFDHPFLQSCTMFLGEILCLIAFKILHFYYVRRQMIVEDIDLIRGNQNFNPLIFFPPAMFDMVATSLMYVGLELTSVSSFQMLRGSVIVFVALLSRSFVGRVIKNHHWYGILFIVLGLFVVGQSDLTPDGKGKDTNGVITGDLLIIMAQIITACQMVYEEKYVVDKDIPPLQAVGWEGVFGFTVLSLLLIPFNYIHVPPPFSNNAGKLLEDLPDAFVQISHNYWILLGMIGTVFSIAFFNFAGISMTKEISSTTRMVLDSVRTFFIWMFSLAFMWQSFFLFQLLGFFLLLVGMALYYQLVVVPRLQIFGRFQGRNIDTQERDEPIINQRADEA